MNARAQRQVARVCIGKAAIDVGELSLVRDARREFSAFAYERGWLAHRDAFAISPDLPLVVGHVSRRAPGPQDSPFPFAFADTEPDAWGQRVIARAHAKRRLHDPSVAPLTRFDYLTAVDDESRTGALRLRDADGRFLNSGDTRRTPPLVELGKVYRAAHALEAGTETDADLLYLQGKATSLGGLRPKSTVLEEDGSLALGKFPSLGDGRSVVRGEVLALTLMERAALHPAACRLVVLDGTPMAVIRRFDRQPNGERLHYLSMGSVLQARRDEDHAYTEIADALRQISATPTDDVRLLWKRLVFNLLVNNVDDHLWNMGVLYAGDGKWRLAPAFDVNPFPDRARESKTWLSEDSGPITHLEQLLGACGYFGYARAAAEDAVAQIGSVLAGWRDVATSTRVGLSEGEAEDFAPAFEHGDALLARSLTLA